MQKSISTSVEHIEPSYEVVVVGSGYGGAIAASRLARAGKKVCVLERGREVLVGEFPETAEALLGQLQIADATGSNRLGLFDLHANDPVSVVVGCGLGGTSLINANVSIEPDPRVFLDGRWPPALTSDLASLQLGYARARAVLQPAKYPTKGDQPAKLEAHRASAVAMGREKEFDRVELNVHFEKAINAVGEEQQGCTRCGNCASGCNVGAKGTLMMNYLPDAKNHGATLVTQAQVRHVTREGSRWAVHFVPVVEGVPLDAEAPTQFVLADVVVLAAGAIGSTEIMLRSKRLGLSLSSQVGQHFSGNGDQLSFAYDSDRVCDGLGWAPGKADMTPFVGPTITSGIYIRGKTVNEDVLIEEGAIPSSLVAAAPWALASTSLCQAHHLPGWLRVGHAAKSTQTYLIMSLDADAGHVELDANNRARIVWPGAGAAPDLQLGKKYATEAAKGIGATYLDNPLWTGPVKGLLISVHPLGGCAMGESGAVGAVNDRCEVFDSEGKTVNQGLFVCDGSVVPSALGVNPLFTISAIAERAIAKLAEARRLDHQLHAPEGRRCGRVRGARATRQVGLQFSESMTGTFAPDAPDFESGAAKGQADGITLVTDLTIQTDHLDAMLRNPAHEAALTGTVTAPSLSPSPLTVTHGVLNLFYETPAMPGLRFMRYRMRLTSTAGTSWWFDGFKHIGNDSPTAAVHDSTTLYLTLYEGTDDTGPVAGRGILRIGAAGIEQLVESVHVTGADGFFGRVAASAKFFATFAGIEVATYLACIRKWNNPEAPPGSIPPPPPR